jgi:hypothetical protein
MAIELLKNMDAATPPAPRPMINTHPDGAKAIDHIGNDKSEHAYSVAYQNPGYNYFLIRNPFTRLLNNGFCEANGKMLLPKWVLIVTKQKNWGDRRCARAFPIIRNSVSTCDGICGWQE